MQHYVIKFVSDLRQVGGFSQGPPVSSTNKTDRHDITEILLKVALSTIKQNLFLKKNIQPIEFLLLDYFIHTCYQHNRYICFIQIELTCFELNFILLSFFHR